MPDFRRFLTIALAVIFWVGSTGAVTCEKRECEVVQQDKICRGIDTGFRAIARVCAGVAKLATVGAVAYLGVRLACHSDFCSRSASEWLDEAHSKYEGRVFDEWDKQDRRNFMWCVPLTHIARFVCIASFVGTPYVSYRLFKILD